MNEKNDICFNRSNLRIATMQKAIYVILSIGFSVIWPLYQAHAQQSFTFEKIVDTDTQMPGGPGTFGGSSAFSAPSLDGPHLAFIGHNNGAHGYKAIYVVNNNNFFIVADTNTPMPNTGGLTFQDFNGATTSFPLSLSGGSVVFRGSNRSSSNTAGIYAYPLVVADFNTPVPDGSVPNGSLNFLGSKFSVPAMDGGNVVFAGGNIQQEGIYTRIGGTYQVIADLDTIRPGTTENFDRLTSASPVPSVDIEGQAVAFFQVNQSSTSQRGVYTNLGGTLRVVADLNTPSGFNFTFFDDVQIVGGDIIFSASNSSTNGIYMERGGQLSVLVDSDTPIPGNLLGRTFAKVLSPSFDNGRLAFIGSVLENFQERFGLYTNIGGELIKVIDSDDMLDGKAPRFLSMSRQGLSGNGIAFKVIFGDSSEGIYVAHYSPANKAPIADAGEGQTVHHSSSVTLDGTGSSDPDGNTPLTFMWEILDKPVGSSAALSDLAVAMPSFTADLPGDYTIRLVVTDSLGQTSAPDQVIISTFNTAPIADAGPDQSVTLLGTSVAVDGSQSYDDDGDPITYFWTLTRPVSSSASLSDPTLPTPTFIADVQGDYELTLVVTDSFGLTSIPDVLQVSFNNTKPVANSGNNQAVLVGDTVLLDGGGSSDANGDPLTFLWNINSVPIGSGAMLDFPTSQTPSFVADWPGTYTLSLIVNDGFLDSDPSNATIVATLNASNVVGRLMSLIDLINVIDTDSLKNQNFAKTLTNKLTAVITSVNNGEYQDAISKLSNDILNKTNGCADFGSPDLNDMIIDCATQDQLYPLIVEVIELLSTLN